MKKILACVFVLLLAAFCVLGVVWTSNQVAKGLAITFNQLPRDSHD
jgi:hypothetical protein